MTPKIVKEYREAFGGRRFVLTVGAGIVNSILFATGIMTEPTFMTLTMATVGAYLAANTTERIKGKPDQQSALDTPKAV